MARGPNRLASPESWNFAPRADGPAPGRAPVRHPRFHLPDAAAPRVPDLLRHGSQVLEQLIRDEALLVVGAEYSLETGMVDFFDGVPPRR